MPENEVSRAARRAGVVGAGGAGFPTAVKLAAEVDTYLVNGAECEPLLYKDKELMRLEARRLLDGLRLAMGATGAKRGVIAVKAKYEDAIAAMRAAAPPNIEFHLFDNFYPAGDEYVVVYDVTGRLIPPGGIPLQVGCAVSNVESLINVSCAMEDVPVTRTAITVNGAVNEPCSFWAPVGVTIRDTINFAGGATIDDPAVIDGGPMMGRAVLDLDQPVTKTTGGFIVLPKENKLIQRKTHSDEVNKKIARSACDQCSFCTELCPRFLLGYAVEPHKVMRSAGFAGDQMEEWGRYGLLCCECSLCDLYSCPEDLPPKDMCVMGKRAWQQKGVKPTFPNSGLGRAHPMRDARRVPIDRLIQRLGLTKYNQKAPMTDRVLEPQQVRLLLKQHVGIPATPAVQVGDRVQAGQEVALIPEGKLGAPVHTSMSGVVRKIDDTSIWIAR